MKSFFNETLNFLFRKTHWMALYVNGNNATYFDGFRMVYIPKEIKEFIGLKIF